MLKETNFEKKLNIKIKKEIGKNLRYINQNQRLNDLCKEKWPKPIGLN